jgi:hypothetical protein
VCVDVEHFFYLDLCTLCLLRSLCVSSLYYVLLTILFAQKMAPPGLDRPSNSTLDRTAHLLFGDDAPFTWPYVILLCELDDLM